MLQRDIKNEFLKLLQEYPVVTLLGPRQAGKTTLARSLSDDYQYINLESPEEKDFATHDPKGFLKQIKGRVILDEIQRVPQLLSYIQLIVDEQKINGQFVLTGSHQLQLKESITQSLAGRTAILTLLPFSIRELTKAQQTLPDFPSYAIQGFLPRIYDQKQRAHTAYSNYFQTYVERDVRQLIHLKEASLFEKFMKLLAGRVGQLIDYNSLANDVGVDAKTIKNWLSILEASFIVYKLSPYYENFGKRMIKSPKYYFIDVGLLSYLLGLENSQQVLRDPLVGHLFENLVVIEALKFQLNQGKQPQLYFLRDQAGNEVDLVWQKGRELVAIEIKSSSTFSIDLAKGLVKTSAFSDKFKKFYLVYNGEEKKLSSGICCLNFSQTFEIFEP
ncbi:MAG: ATP-binding protein [Pseudobdellovibrionaceae bacterium]